MNNAEKIAKLVEIDHSDKVSARRAVIEFPSQIQGEPLDCGFWLLFGPKERQARWKALQSKNWSALRVKQFVPGGLWSVAKRSFDFVCAACLLIGLLPLFFAVAIFIKLDSPGPVFFRHTRIGKDGRSFSLWKFRSMKTDVPRYEISPQSSSDKRLTRMGRLLRRMSVDELPQLINVLNGDMSLVGPRPEMPFIVAQYHSAEKERLAAVPGITGLWQISPARAFPIHENLSYDLHYIRNQNFFLDCAILIRTVTAVVHGIGAV
jgi:lipopolysaccharide/colanic/teichoic acid biosynthesis glycosyltransferase